ncbi:DUF1287 domain-containing protein [Leucothrix sargassi]|nr:DUF1287 domain-containing protein [Leucothrix sargassi]
MGKPKPVTVKRVAPTPRKVVARPVVTKRVAPKKPPIVVAKATQRQQQLQKQRAIVNARAQAAQKAEARKVAAQKAAAKKAALAKKSAAQKPVYKKPVAPRSNLQYAVNRQQLAQYRKAVVRKPVPQKRRVTRIDPDQSFGYALSNAAIDRTKHKVRYDGAYIKIGYPWGDVPKAIGVCTDVVIRAYRKLGIDLQKEVHEDISRDFYAYPNLKKWGLTKPDPNIDHRRVYNLQAFFKRHKAELPRSRNPKDYKPGDLVTWMVGPSFPHIGVVVNKPSKADPNRLMISHNIGYGPQIEDILFRYPMTGHYRYTPKNKKINPALHFAKTPPPASVRKQNAMDYNDLLEASRYLIGDGNKAKKDKKVLQVKQTTPQRINLAQLDTAALNALMKY